MRPFLASLISLLLLASPAQACNDTARASYALAKWKDASPVKPVQREKLRRCGVVLGRPFRRFVQSRKNKFFAYRKLRLVTPYECSEFGTFAIPCDVVFCESEFNWRAQNPVSTASGAYQILTSTWRAYGGGRFASTAAGASKYGQSLVARRILLTGYGNESPQGPNAWTCW